ncbi:competence pheromone ComX [Ureibacillus massiliensis]|uniref:competence pheromone ComX n=1 Tax=Ureibacillus massiliensis TaxID=292806 RepID=UPI000A012306|nr:competence pheromone ComX [Ureibacillus massiliensis]
MNKLIQYLIENPTVVSLLQQNKASLVGVSPAEQQAITDAFRETTVKPLDLGWR